ncbi:tRNA-intron lyase [Candidatus Pacearchaeota archaeon]|nr:tRNA-intron lyase [Candidatus Pacearchaeota archaeon]
MKVRKEGRQVKKKPADKEKNKIFKVVLAGERVFSNAKEAFTLYDSSRLGEPKEGKVYYSLVETLYLLEKGKLQVYKGKKKVTSNMFLKEAQLLENNFHTRFIVFRDMRNRGYIVKTALKFGADFRVYERGVKPGQEHAKWILYPVFESTSLTWHEFAAKNRVAHSTRKKLLIAIVDDENDVTYYEVAWRRP